jgi:tRNA threonylcarbamoyladenosine biosynthesis protein TsaB
MKILCFDTSNNLASVAVISNDEILAYNSTDASSQQAEKLFYLIDITLKESKLIISELDLIAISNGPGSFTGVRIAISSALGLELASELKIIALTNFQIVAYNARAKHAQGNIYVVLDARNENFYVQEFDQELLAIGDPKLINIDELKLLEKKNLIFAGNGISYMENFDDDLAITCNAKYLAQACSYFFTKDMYHALEPLYVRPAYVNI